MLFGITTYSATQPELGPGSGYAEMASGRFTDEQETRLFLIEKYGTWIDK